MVQALAIPELFVSYFAHFVLYAVIQMPSLYNLMRFSISGNFACILHFLINPAKELKLQAQDLMKWFTDIFADN